jgi:Low-density lipoprotein receptor domain class A
MAYGSESLWFKPVNDAEGEDEEPEMCRDKVRCTPGQFMCQLSGTCVSIRSVCNGVRDCEDGSDEFGCSSSQSPAEEHHQVQ